MTPHYTRPPRAVQNAEHQYDRDDVAGERPEIDDVEAPPIIALHFFGIVAKAAEVLQ